MALLSARERATGHAAGARGLAGVGGPALAVYASAEAHSSVPKGVKLAGYGLDMLRLIPGNCDPTVNLYDHYVGCRGQKVESSWPVSARGPGT